MTWNGGIAYSPSAGTSPSPIAGYTINNSSAEIWYAYASAWSAWTPTRTNLTVGNGTETAKYFSIGGRAHFMYKLLLGSTSSVGTDPTLRFSLFYSQWDRVSSAGVASFYDSSAGVWYPGVIGWEATVNTVTVNVNSSTPFPWATGDILSLSWSAGKQMPPSTIGE